MIGSPTHGWEHSLLSQAHEAYHSFRGHAGEPAGEGARATQALREETGLLEQAYTYCKQLTAEHSRSFYLASGLLPPEKRRAVRALYAFCRVSDDLVDEGSGDVVQEFNAWRQRILSPTPPAGDLVAVAWTDARVRYHIPVRYAEQLLDGVARDMEPARYQTFEELAAYAYGVASTVGLMSMYIIGFSGPEALPYAIRLGVALQLTNILRDVGEDWQAGRLYLPLDELAAHGLSEEDVGAGRVDDRWRRFLNFQIRRARRLYEEAWPGIGMLSDDGRLAIGMAAGVYRAILGDIEAHDYDVFNRRAYVGRWGKLRLLPGVWRRTRRFR